METIYKNKKGTYMTREEKIEFLKGLKRARVYYEWGDSAEFDYITIHLFISVIIMVVNHIQHMTDSIGRKRIKYYHIWM